MKCQQTKTAVLTFNCQNWCPNEMIYLSRMSEIYINMLCCSKLLSETENKHIIGSQVPH